jgi:hypothetical protein
VTAGKRAAVKIRWERGGVIGPWMTPAEAADLVEDLEQQVLDCGDGCGFVPFTGFDGRDVLIGGREVITIECLPEAPARLMPPVIPDRPTRTVTMAGGHVDAAATLTMNPPAAARQDTPGTHFLRQQAARQHANGSRQ